MPNLPNVCIDQTLTDEELEVAQQRSFTLNPANEPDPALEMAVAPMWLWPAGHRIKIRFLDGDPVVHKKVVKHAKEWEKHANIYFDFGDHDEAEIRISFAIAGQSWSKLGTQALGLTDQSKPTMNFGWLEPDSKEHIYSSVVLHEFGHALGCIHEHQHPDNPIPWDEDAVYKYYTGEPNNWSRLQTKMNVLLAYPAGQTQFTKFDPKSIMLYPIPNAHTKGNWFIDWENDQLSEKDKEFIAKQYPPTDQDDSERDGERRPVAPLITGGEGNVSDAQPANMAAPGTGPEDPVAKKERNALARSIRSEVVNLQNVLTSIQAGETSLRDQAAYIQKTVLDIPPYVTSLAVIDGGDETRTIENLWEQMQFNPLLQNPTAEFDPQQQASYINRLNANIKQMITIIGNMTIPERINDWLKESRLGYYFSFHEVFEDELADPLDRDRLLKHLKWAPNVLENGLGLVDQQNGLIYRTTKNQKVKNRSRFLLIMTLLATFVLVIVLAMPSFIDQSWPLKLGNLPALLLGWAALLVGIVVHIMVSSYKRGNEAGGRPPIVAIGDLSLWLNAKIGQIILRMGLALFAFCGLAFGTGSVTILNAFLVGYSLDSFLEIFSGSLNGEATNLTEQFRKG